jgi:hypothetical protein
MEKDVCVWERGAEWLLVRRRGIEGGIMGVGDYENASFHVAV